VLGLIGELEAADAIAFFIDAVDGFGDHVHVGLRVDAAGDGEAD
jgi:hypothetical protein